jgi:hypothetical protein
MQPQKPLSGRINGLGREQERILIVGRLLNIHREVGLGIDGQ